MEDDDEELFPIPITKRRSYESASTDQQKYNLNQRNPATDRKNTKHHKTESHQKETKSDNRKEKNNKTETKMTKIPENIQMRKSCQ